MSNSMASSKKKKHTTDGDDCFETVDGEVSRRPEDVAVQRETVIHEEVRSGKELCEDGVGHV